MRAFALTVLGLATAAAVATRLSAQTTLSDETVRRIDAVYAKVSDPSAPGCAVGVFQNGRIVLEKGYGSADIEYGVPITGKTPFIMGSVSKQFTAAAIALLVERGKLRLDDDVHRYVPELPDYGKPITIDELVHHTSGVRDFWALYEAAGVRLDDGYTVGDILRLAARQHHLNFDPGAEYNYSNTGYVLLGVVVQRVTGQTLRQFADAEIFQPLGMTISHFHDDHNEPVRGRAIAYAPAPGGKWKIDVWNNDIVGQGGLMTNVEDLQKWDENFYTGRVGGAGFLARQLQRGVLNDGKTLAYAFGLEIGQYRGLPIVEHSGSTGGYRTDITRFPAQHTTVATMCNFSTANSVGLAHAVADVVLADRFTKPAPTPARRSAARQAASGVVLSEAALAPRVGRYYSDELDATYELTAANGALVLHRGLMIDTLRATDAQTFHAGGLTLHFEPSPAPNDAVFSIENGRARGIGFTRVGQAKAGEQGGGGR